MKRIVKFVPIFIAIILFCAQYSHKLNVVKTDKAEVVQNTQEMFENEKEHLISSFTDSSSSDTTETIKTEVTSLEDIPEFNGEDYYISLNNGVPDIDITDGSKEFETYSDLDSLGRCGVAYANLSQDTMPTEERGDISDVYPSGWEQKEYEIDGSEVYLYNRSHLIAFCLAGENANKKNLITGTEYMNQQVMTQFENMVADYINETDNHVLYRVTPVFTDNNLVADGVQMEALSVEDNGSSIEFNVFIYNVEPGVDINYATGKSNIA